MNFRLKAFDILINVFHVNFSFNNMTNTMGQIYGGIEPIPFTKVASHKCSDMVPVLLNFLPSPFCAPAN